MKAGPPENANVRVATLGRSKPSSIVDANTHTQRAIAQLREEQDAYGDLVFKSEIDERDFVIRREIDEIRDEETRRRSRSVLRETPLARWCQSRRKGTRS
jgi:hypothetical protein